MVKYIAKAPCRFCGQPFAKGAEVPTELIEPTRINALMREGTLERMEAAEAETVETEAALEPEAQPDEPQAEKVKSSGRKRGTK